MICERRGERTVDWAGCGSFTRPVKRWVRFADREAAAAIAHIRRVGPPTSTSRKIRLQRLSHSPRGDETDGYDDTGPLAMLQEPTGPLLCASRKWVRESNLTLRMQPRHHGLPHTAAISFGSAACRSYEDTNNVARQPVSLLLRLLSSRHPVPCSCLAHEFPYPALRPR